MLIVTLELQDGTPIKIDADSVLGTDTFDAEHTAIRCLHGGRSVTIIVKTATMPDEIRNLR